MTINKEIHPNSGNESLQNGCLGLLLETMWAWGGASPGAAQSNPSSHGKLPTVCNASSQLSQPLRINPVRQTVILWKFPRLGESTPGAETESFFIHGKPDTPKESGMSLGGMGSFSPGERVLGKEHSSLLSAWPSAE